MQKQSHSLLEHKVSVNVLPSKGLKLALIASDAQRLEIAKLAGALSVERFHADLTFSTWQKKGVSMKGRVVAKIIQSCVATLEPIISEIEEEIDRKFLPEGSKLLRPMTNLDGELILDPEGEDEPDSFSGDSLDAWEIVLEHFLLGVDLFPRSGDDETALSWDSDPQPDAKEPSPFAILKDLADKKPD